MIFRKWGGGGQRPFGTFPKIHPFWYGHASLISNNYNWRWSVTNIAIGIRIACFCWMIDPPILLLHLQHWGHNPDDKGERIADTPKSKSHQLGHQSLIMTICTVVSLFSASTLRLWWNMKVDLPTFPHLWARACRQKVPQTNCSQRVQTATDCAEMILVLILCLWSWEQAIKDGTWEIQRKHQPWKVRGGKGCRQ